MRFESRGGIVVGMTTQITVRLPDELVAFTDEQVRAGAATSRADLVAAALERERRRVRGLRDAAIYAALAGQPDPDDLDALARHAARTPLDVD